jgi:phosphohistidine phosphatase SixA
MTDRIWTSIAFFLLTTLSIAASHSESVSGGSLAAAMRTGGYVILMRHASSPHNPPDASTANTDNSNLERQLDEGGRSSARALGEALRHLRIPIGQVLSSPTYRTLETIKFAQLGPATMYPQLGDAGQSMISDKSGTRGAWLRAKTAESPTPGKNTLIVTHFPNIMEAYPQNSVGLADGEALILHPDGRGGVQLVARVRIDEWSHLGTTH